MTTPDATTGLAPVRAARDIVVAPYEDATVASHHEFATRMWPSKRRRREEEYQRWKFRGPASGPVPGLLLALRGDRVVGQLGVIPVTLRVGGTSHDAQWACDLMVDPAERRSGIGSRLLQAAMSRGMVTLGSNPSPAAEATMTHVGFRVITGPRIMVLPLHLRHVLRWVTPPALRALVPVLAAVGAPFARVRRARLARAAAGVVEGPWADGIPRVADRQRRLTAPHVVHDEAFLRWRCSGLTGYAQPLTTLQAGEAFAIAGPAPPYYYVHEWGAPNETSFVEIFRAVHERARASGCDTVQTLANGATEERWLRAVGFLGLRRPFSIIHHSAADVLAGAKSFDYCIYDSDGNL